MKKIQEVDKQLSNVELRSVAMGFYDLSCYYTAGEDDGMVLIIRVRYIDGAVFVWHVSVMDKDGVTTDYAIGKQLWNNIQGYMPPMPQYGLLPIEECPAHIQSKILNLLEWFAELKELLTIS